MTQTLVRRAFPLASVAFLLLPGWGNAAVGPDAGTGLDAGSTRDTALQLSSWSAIEGALSGADSDTFVIQSATEAPRCVTATLGSATHGTFALGSTLAGAVSDVGVKFQDTSQLGLATPASDATLVLVARDDNAPTVEGYTIQFATLQLPQVGLAGGDASSAADAGSTPSNALATAAPCIGGVIGPRLGVSDPLDLYAIQVAANDIVSYSFATPDPQAGVVLVDAAGAALGSVVGSGAVGSASVPSAGTYYLRVSTAASSASGYLIGLGEGPDPGNGCRPMCFL